VQRVAQAQQENPDLLAQQDGRVQRVPLVQRVQLEPLDQQELPESPEGQEQQVLLA
jgi:hypothetical protein